MKNKKCKGFTLIEIIASLVIVSILIYASINVIPSLMDKAKITKVNEDFSALQVVFMQLLQERSGLTKIDETDFYKYFNQYIDSINELSDDNETLQKRDPWGEFYNVKFTKISGSETTVVVSSMGKKTGITSFQLMAHYKDGEVRIGTAGFAVNAGEDHSDAATDEDGVASITTMWAVKDEN